MIKIDSNYYFGEVILRQSSSESLVNAKLAKKIWIGGTQVVNTLTPSNINDYLMTMQGNPTYTVAGVSGSIMFNSSLDICYMKSGVSCRSISGDLRGIDTNYDSRTSTQKYVFVCNFTGPTSIAMTLNKRSHGYYETEFSLWISCGGNSNSWTIACGSNASFSISYNGSAYVASFTAKATVGSKTYSITSPNCREQASRLELAGSTDSYTIGPYTGIHNMKGEITTGMARY